MSGIVFQETLYPVGFFNDVPGDILIGNFIAVHIRVVIDAAVQFLQYGIHRTTCQGSHVRKINGGGFIQAGYKRFPCVGGLCNLVGIECYRMMEYIGFVSHPVDVSFQ